MVVPKEEQKDKSMLLLTKKKHNLVQKYVFSEIFQSRKKLFAHIRGSFSQKCNYTLHNPWLIFHRLIFLMAGQKTGHSAASSALLISSSAATSAAFNLIMGPK